jgi:CheY-like chemotaxis protein
MTDEPAPTVRVLYVEDDQNLRYPISELLKLKGYEVETADNGKLGVEKAESWQPDFILMDLRMPVMDGFEAMRVLRSNPDTKEIPIYVLSAYTDVKTRTSATEAGADGFIAKPPDVDRIDAIIRKTLDR